MAGKWKVVSLDKAIELISGGTPKTSVSAYWNGDIPWLSVADFNTSYRWVSDAEKKITEVGLKESATRMLDVGDIVISARGTVGAVAQLSKPMAFNQSCYGIRGIAGFTDTNYIYYALKIAIKQMKQIAHGGVFDTITRDTFKHLQITLPPLAEQRAIAHILGTLDDKIELNRRMNETLEGMARALFKSWFVDFDPVRAKQRRGGPPCPPSHAEGQPQGVNEEGQPQGVAPTGWPQHILDLFPDAFQDSELGEIPKGWEVKSIGEVAKLATNSISPGKSPDTVFEHYSIPAFDSSHMPAMELGESIMSNKYVVDGDAVLVSKLNPQTPRIWLPKVGVNPAICSTEFMQFIPNDIKDRPYLYCLMDSAPMKEEVLKHVTGSTGSRQRAQPPQIVKVNILYPHTDSRKAFNYHATPLLNAVAENRMTTRTLAALRDTLLPKLISGELRVSDAEKFVEGAG